MTRRSLANVLAPALLALAAAQPALAETSHDGRWSIRVTGDRTRDCDQDLSLSIRVDGGDVRYGGWFNIVDADGEISPAGDVTMRIAFRDEVVDVRGAVAGGVATGHWVSPTLGCSGSWQGTRA